MGPILICMGVSLAVLTLLTPGTQLAIALLSGFLVGAGWSLTGRRTR